MESEPAFRQPLTRERRDALLQLAVWISLVLSILAIYGQSVLFDFVNYDDPQNVAANPHVQGGVTPAIIKWAFTSVTTGNWLPATMLSHIVATQVFGMASGMHHLVNIVLHLLSALLLFAVFQRATGQLLASAFVALIFAVHPLHVESVAWIAERKDVLSAFFFFLALYGYVRYTERPSPSRYVWVIVAFGVGLMSKPMLVTFPFVLLLFDFWPLRRLHWPKVLWEKLPLVALSLGESMGTYWIQRFVGSIQATIPLTTRLSNAWISYIVYIRQTFWPTRLAVFYPYPHSIAAWQAWGSLAVILGVTAVVISVWRTRPHYAVGWFWYLGMLVPVIGFAQTGYQAHADRYMYLPMVGLSLMLAWGAGDVVRKWPKAKLVLMASAAVSGLLCMALAWKQAAYWENSETLFRHAIEVTEDNWLAHGNLGQFLMNIPERRGEAMAHLETAVRLRPLYPEAHNNLGACLAEAGLCNSAIPHFEAALRETPNEVGANTNLGLCLLKASRYGEAADRFQTALRRDPNFPLARLNLGLALSNLPGREGQAIPEFEAALRLSPDLAEAHHGLAVLLMKLGRTGEALSHFEAEQRIHPSPEVSRIVEELRSRQK